MAGNRSFPRASGEYRSVLIRVVHPSERSTRTCQALDPWRGTRPDGTRKGSSYVTAGIRTDRGLDPHGVRGVSRIEADTLADTEVVEFAGGRLPSGTDRVDAVAVPDARC